MANGLDYKIRKLEIAYAIADKTVGRGASESEEQEKYLNGLRRALKEAVKMIDEAMESTDKKPSAGPA